MTVQETIQLIEALKAAGVTNYKSGDMELSFTPIGNPPAALVPIDAPHELPEDIKHKVEELTSLMKLSDVELVDRLFPDTHQEEAVN